MSQGYLPATATGQWKGQSSGGASGGGGGGGSVPILPTLAHWIIISY